MQQQQQEGHVVRAQRSWWGRTYKWRYKSSCEAKLRAKQQQRVNQKERIRRLWQPLLRRVQPCRPRQLLCRLFRASELLSIQHRSHALPQSLSEPVQVSLKSRRCPCLLPLPREDLSLSVRDKEIYRIQIWDTFAIHGREESFELKNQPSKVGFWIIVQDRRISSRIEKILPIIDDLRHFWWRTSNLEANRRCWSNVLRIPKVLHGAVNL